jgi:hypothetical protein
MLRFFTFLDHETILELDEATRTAPAGASGPARRGQRRSSPWCTAPTRRRGPNGPARRCSPKSIADLDEATLLQVVADAPSSTVARRARRRHRRRRAAGAL